MLVGNNFQTIEVLFYLHSSRHNIPNYLYGVYKKNVVRLVRKKHLGSLVGSGVATPGPIRDQVPQSKNKWITLAYNEGILQLHTRFNSPMIALNIIQLIIYN